MIDGLLCIAYGWLILSSFSTRLCLVFDAIYADSGVELKALKVDGGGTVNSLLMQFQADIIGVDVIKPVVQETTARGAAFAAGLAVGIWNDLDELRALWSIAKIFTKKMTDEDRAKNWGGWQKAVTKSLGWVEDEDEEKFFDAKDNSFHPAVLVRELRQPGYSLGTVLVASALALATGILLAGRRSKG
jgi:ribulose kinase